MEGKRDNSIDLIRLLAAFMVFAGHMSSLLGYPMPMYLWQPVNQVGVIIFFLFGGYLITLSWERDSNVLRYFVKRFFRIFPAYAVCIVLTACVIGPIFTTVPLADYFAHHQFAGYFKNLLFRTQFFLPAVFTDNPIPNVLNGSYWCLAPEVAMYINIPILYAIGDRMKIKKPLFVICAVLSCIASIIHLHYFPEFRYVIFDMDVAQAMTIVPFYFIGAAVAVCKPDRKYFNIYIAVVLYFFTHCLVIDSVGPAWTMDIVVLSYVILSLGFAKPKWDLRKYDYSYGIFVWGFLIQQMVIHIFYIKLQIYPKDHIVFLISFLITLGISALSERFVERPCSRLSKKICSLSLKKNNGKK